MPANPFVTEVYRSLAHLLGELASGAPSGGGAFVLNSGDTGLLRSLDTLDAAQASTSVNGGASVAAHATHLQYGLSLMNRWAREGGDPFADATWDQAWKTREVSGAQWQQIRDGLRRELAEWAQVLAQPRELTGVALTGHMASVVHLAYHFGAIRQIAVRARGPREGTFPDE
jgi:hypothetical protein